ncbi:MFS general substrate transporter [Punctularia strigosozonata HHB-11173 SS5]|uniref:MFS general substrate transporter n=1 Tax=Punctularia strigosozonata (strain HHB-11173) TaxID=741275 RepID=UPI000441718A|nr:MFS general substrate transporter [Punctularia strigosozonata HHB-11173 SS5]EIN13724.1 MFS general substrate transporter [Punctularia strigosozonata HHB-11173 SS5]
MRGLALLCACSLSIGSHYGRNLLGPLKSRLHREMGTNNTEFSLLVSALSLNSTWTPILGGLLASRLGATYTSILATSIILLGQAVLLIGNLSASVRMMAFGLFIFGLGVSPLAVVQETIIVRFFHSHGLGISMALGLVAGKAASFVAARTSYPLSQHYGPHAPFVVATTLAALSVGINLSYVAASRWIIKETDTEMEAAEISEDARRYRLAQNLSEADALDAVARKKRVHIRDITKLGDVFWAYIAINILCGSIWEPFHHLAPNIIQLRYDLSESQASDEASWLLAGSVVLYPIVGLVVDRFRARGIVLRLLLLSSILTFLCYIWLALPPHATGTAMPAIISFCVGQGFAPLLLVVIVPELVASKFVSTTLGVHKSLEQTGSVTFQTLAGLSLDTDKPSSGDKGNPTAIQHLLNTFASLNVLQFCGILALRYLDRHRRAAALASDPAYLAPESGSTDRENDPRRRVKEAMDVNVLHDAFEDDEHEPLPSTSFPEQRRPLLPQRHSQVSEDERRLQDEVDAGRDLKGVALSHEEVRRGECFAISGTLLIVLTWVLFMVTAWLKLRSKADREGPPS